MKLTQIMTLLVTLALVATFLTVAAQHPAGEFTSGILNTAPNNNSSVSVSSKRIRPHKLPLRRPVIPPVTVLNNPEYLSGEASISVAANSNPLIRIGIAQNGVTLIEFPAADKFF